MTASSSSGPSRDWGLLGIGAAAVAACAVCCAGPLLAVLGGVGLASAVGALWIPGLAASAVVSGLGVLMVRRRRRRAACRTAPARTDLGMPTVGPSPERSEVVKTGR
ncbi:hypothetical protein GA0115260_103106 [Streptomyces sp. MnatMP-M27]|uniref:hypothetical protein n=1 Tax=Streptomyces sp. MnatMP-M27 TaxID=1839768 RepID=UPI00081DF7EB|nr:hypothetical protein [Streptomyces sp. MnatMP-M27]SCF84216.1 hypothetical protein GA0115260_103106 [Streptomyces sp. MnatMP-M27]